MLHNTMRCWAEISSTALKHNYEQCKKNLPENCAIMGVVKANAYGHGAPSVAAQLIACGAQYLAVACLQEAIELREDGIRAPILILGHTDPRYAEELYLHRLTQTVHDLGCAQALSDWAAKRGVTLLVHLKIDTGMSRLGLLCDEAHLEQTAGQIAQICALPGLYAEGIFTHLSSADCDVAYTATQLRRFSALLILLEQRELLFDLRHCEASSACGTYNWLHYPVDEPFHLTVHTAMNMVRLGISLYGHGQDGDFVPAEHGLIPVMRLFARVAQISELDAGARISYGGTFICPKPMRVAVLGIGYADGYPRALSGRHHVLLHGKKAPILGRICMDMCIVDISEIDGVQLDDAAEIFGELLPIELATKTLDTIPYELLCAISMRVARIDC